jgi:hypothetical protein
VTNPLELDDPFPSNRSIIPVEEEEVTDPDTGHIRALQRVDIDRAQELARQKVRVSSQQMEKLSQKITPSSRPVPGPKKTD